MDIPDYKFVFGSIPQKADQPVPPESVETPGMIWVNAQSEKTTEDGSILYPFKSLQDGIDAATFGDVIKVGPGEYSENVTINGKQNLTIVVDGSIGQYRAVVEGNLTVSGTTQRLNLQNIQIDGNYSCSTAAGSVYADNIAVNGTVNLTGGGYHRYDFCFFKGMNVTGASNTLVHLRACQSESGGVWLANNAAATVAIFDSLNLMLNHVAGNVYIGGATLFLKDGSGNGLISTANLGSGAIWLDGGTFLQADGTFAKLNKTGSCPYILSTIVYEPQNATLNGTKMDAGLHSDQIYDHYARAGYTKAGDTLKGHLDGIGAQLLTQKNILDDILAFLPI